MRNIDNAIDSQTYTVATAIATFIAALTDASGVPLEGGQGGAKGCACVLSAESGQTITGGTLRCMAYMPVAETFADNTLPVPTYRWMKYPNLDLTPGTGSRDWPSGDFPAYTGIGRIIWLPDAVTVSGGTTAVVTTTARRAQGGS